MSMRRSTRLYKDLRNLLGRAHLMFRCGFWQRLPWYEAMKRVPPMDFFGEDHPGTIYLPQDKYSKILNSKFPILELEIHNGVDYEAKPPLSVEMCKRFAMLIEKEGMTVDEATDKLEDEFLEDLAELEDSLMFVRGDMQPVTPANIAYVMKRRAEEQKLRGQAAKKEMRRARFTEKTELSVAKMLGETPRIGATAVPLKAEDEKEAIEDEKKAFDVALRYREKRVLAQNQQLQMLCREIDSSHLTAEEKLDAKERLYNVLKDFRLAELAEIRSHDVYSNSTSNMDFLRKERSEQIRSYLLDVMRTQNIPGYEVQRRDYIAFILREQIVTLKNPYFARWEPYTDAVDELLWKQAWHLLKAPKLALLTREKGHDHYNVHNMAYPFKLEPDDPMCEQLKTELLDETQSEIYNPDDETEKNRMKQFPKESLIIEQHFGLFNSMPILYSIRDEQRMTSEDKKKHVKLMEFIDSALDRLDQRRSEETSKEIQRLKSEIDSDRQSAAIEIYKRCKKITKLENPNYERLNKVDNSVRDYLLGNAKTVRPNYAGLDGLDEEDTYWMKKKRAAKAHQETLQRKKEAIKLRNLLFEKAEQIVKQKNGQLQIKKQQEIEHRKKLKLSAAGAN